MIQSKYENIPVKVKTKLWSKRRRSVKGSLSCFLSCAMAIKCAASTLHEQTNSLGSGEREKRHKFGCMALHLLCRNVLLPKATDTMKSQVFLHAAAVLVSAALFFFFGTTDVVAGGRSRQGPGLGRSGIRVPPPFSRAMNGTQDGRNKKGVTS